MGDSRDQIGPLPLLAAQDWPAGKHSLPSSPPVSLRWPATPQRPVGIRALTSASPRTSGHLQPHAPLASRLQQVGSLLSEVLSPGSAQGSHPLMRRSPAILAATHSIISFCPWVIFSINTHICYIN